MAKRTLFQRYVGLEGQGEVEKALKEASKVAVAFARKHQCFYKVDEVMSEALLSVAGAIEKHNPAQAALSTFVHHEVRYRLLDWWRESEAGNVPGMPMPRLEQKKHEGFGPHAILIDHFTRENEHGDQNRVEFEDERIEDLRLPLERRDLVMRLLRGLTKNEREVVLLYYFEELNFAEIGHCLCVCESRACQIHTKALGKLRAAAARVA